MRVAVIEHRLRGDAVADARALAEAAQVAADGGAEAVFLPCVVPVDHAEANEEMARLMAGIPGTRLMPRIAAGVRAQVFPVTDQVPVVGERLGKVALLHGDACVNEDVLRGTASAEPAVLVLTPGSESELQAEAMLELAVGLSDSAAGLVVIAECVGAEAGEPGHGGSAVVSLGAILAESTGEEGGVLFAEVPEPVSPPTPRQSIPVMPTILAQRRANHEGRKFETDYPADLS